MSYAVDNFHPAGSCSDRSAISSEDADVAIQRCLNRLALAAYDADARQIVRELLSVAAEPIGLLCRSTLSRHYPRLVRGPFNLQPDELLGAVVERLIKAMRNVRPKHIREFFALVRKHVRWELNEMARGLDAYQYESLTIDAIAREPQDHEATIEQFSPRGRRILEAINSLPNTDRQIFNLIRVGGMAQADAAEVLGISVRTIQRRLNCIQPQLSRQLGGLQFAQGPGPETDRTLRPCFISDQRMT